MPLILGVVEVVLLRQREKEAVALLAALGEKLTVLHPLKDIEGVPEVEGELEVEKLALGDGELLPVELCDTERVAQ